MVKVVEGLLVINTIVQKSILVEIVGPAGAGKTTLSRVLSQRSEKILMGPDIEFRKIRQIPVFIRNAPLVLPLFLQWRVCSRWFSWDEIKSMVYLKGWHSVLKQQAVNNGAIVLLDQGPIYRLATLYAFGPDWLGNQVAESWWDDMFKQWALMLDIIVWLDAPDSILEKRINTRNKGHVIKGKSEVEAHEYLARYRTSYEYVLEKITIYGGPRLLQFDTSQTSIEQTVEEVLNSFDWEGGK